MRNQWRMFLADTIAMVSFSTTLCMLIEVFVAGMSLGQSLTARVAAVPVNLLTGRAYGLYRDWLFGFLHIGNDYRTRTVIGDTVAFITFQLPLYALVLSLARATLGQMAVSGAMMTVIFAITGRPYGLFLDFCRKRLASML